MKRILLCACIVLSALAVCAQEQGEPYFSQIIANPDNTLRFNFYVFHDRYKWVESKEATYAEIPIVIQNDAQAQPLKWEDYKIFLLLADGTLLNNYTTVAKDGVYSCVYSLAPGDQHVQHVCYGKSFSPKQITKVWLRMTDSNFIDLHLNYLQAEEKAGTVPRAAGTVTGDIKQLLVGTWQGDPDALKGSAEYKKQAQQDKAMADMLVAMLKTMRVTFSSVTMTTEVLDDEEEPVGYRVLSQESGTVRLELTTGEKAGRSVHVTFLDKDHITIRSQDKDDTMYFARE